MTTTTLCPQAWAALTTTEADVLRSLLVTGATVAAAVDPYGNHALFMETHAVISDVREARRLRWNTENPDHQIED